MNPLDIVLQMNKLANAQLDTILTPVKNVRHIPVIIQDDRAFARVFTHIEGKPEAQIKFYSEQEPMPELF